MITMYYNNHIKTVLVLFALVILWTGCDDFLATPPADQYTQANFWKNEEEVEAALTGVYEVLRGYPRSLILHSDVLTPNAAKFDDPGGWRAIARGEALTTNDLFESAWTSDYRGIGRANTVLANMDKAELPEDVSNRIEGEAKFLRA